MKDPTVKIKNDQNNVCGAVENNEKSENFDEDDYDYDYDDDGKGYDVDYKKNKPN